MICTTSLFKGQKVKTQGFAAYFQICKCNDLLKVYIHTKLLHSFLHFGYFLEFDYTDTMCSYIGSIPEICLFVSIVRDTILWGISMFVVPQFISTHLMKILLYQSVCFLQCSKKWFYFVSMYYLWIISCLKRAYFLY